MAAEVAAPSRKRPDRVLWEFFARRTLRSATFVSVIFGLIAASKVLGYAAVYPTKAQQVSAGLIMTGQATYKVLLGVPQNITTVAGFAACYSVGVSVLLGGIWAYVVTTKMFRGEETAGRWEVLLSSETTMRDATISAFKGLAVSLGVYFVIATLALMAIGAKSTVNYGAGPALYFGLAVVAGAVMFAAVGAFTSQIMPTRGRAAGLATIIFGLSFLLRAAGDVSGTHWLVDISPLGWVEQLNPLFNSQPIWLVPIVLTTAILVGSTILLAAHRDLGASIIADRDTARPRYALLGSPLGAALRLNGPGNLAWLAGIVAFSAFFGALTHTAIQVFSASQSANQLFEHFTHSLQASSARAFLGVMYLITIVVLMCYSAYAVGTIRSDEAIGLSDNLLVGPLGRVSYLWVRGTLALATIVLASGLGSLATKVSLGSHLYGLTAHDFVLAAVNCLPAAIFTLGVGLFALGVAPRLATVLAYGVAAWSFIIQMLASGLHLNHWLLDTSVFTHIALTPASPPQVEQNWILVLLGLALALAGTYWYNRRDLEGE